MVAGCVAKPGRGFKLELLKVRPSCVQSGAVPPGSIGGLVGQAPEVTGCWWDGGYEGARDR